MLYRNKLIWITGASSGIGEELAIQFSQLKAKLVLSSRRQEELIRVRDICRISGENCMVLPLDIENHQQCADAVKKVIGFFGRIDIMVHNAGISQRSLIIDTYEEVNRKIMETNFFGTIELTRLILPFMIENGGGHFVVISSIVGKMGFPLRSAYSASKHALHGYFETLRLEMKQKNIAVTMIIPGRIKTNISLNAIVADGSRWDKLDEGQINGMPVNIACKQIISAINKKKKEKIVAREEKILLLLKRWWPHLSFMISSKFNS